MAHKTGAIGPKDLERVAVDTTVQPKAVAHPTDARLTHRAITKLVGFAKRNRVPLRQSYLRLAKRAAIMVGRYSHAHQFTCAGGRVHRQGESPRALRVRLQGQYRHPRDVPEGRTVRAPCQGAARQSLRRAHARPRGRRHGEAHGVEARRIHVDKGYRGHNHPHRLGVWISGQVRRVTASIRREMKRRAAVEPVIGHVKAEHRMDRNYLKGRVGVSTPSSPRPATTSACFCGGSQNSCVPSSGSSPKLSRLKRSLKSAVGRVLHGGPMNGDLPTTNQCRASISGCLSLAEKGRPQ